MNLLRRSLWNFGILFASNVAGQLFYLAGTIHIARTVSVGAFGLWNLAQAWLMYLFRVGEAGLEVAGIRSIARAHASDRQTVWTVLAVRGVLAAVLVVAVVAAAGSGIVPEGSAGVLTILAAALVPSGLVLEWLFEAKQSVGPVGFARFLKGAAFALGVVLLVKADADMTKGAWVYVGSLALASAVVAWEAFRRFKLLPPAWSTAGIRAMLGESLPISGATLFWQYSLFIGTLLAGYVATEEQLGFYTAGHRLVVFLWAYGIVSSNRVLLPALARRHAESEEQFTAILLRTLRFLALAAVPVVVVGIAAGGMITEFLYGGRYAPSGDVVRILSIALGTAIARSVLETGLIACGRQKAYMAGMGFLALAYTAGSILGFHYGDIAGLAWAAVAAEMLFAGYMVWVVRLVPAAAALEAVWRPLLAAVAGGTAAVAAGFIGMGAPAGLAAGVVTAAAVLAGTGAIRPADLRAGWHQISTGRGGQPGGTAP